MKRRFAQNSITKYLNRNPVPPVPPVALQAPLPPLQALPPRQRPPAPPPIQRPLTPVPPDTQDELARQNVRAAVARNARLAPIPEE